MANATGGALCIPYTIIRLIFSYILWMRIPSFPRILPPPNPHSFSLIDHKMKRIIPYIVLIAAAAFCAFSAVADDIKEDFNPIETGVTQYRS